MMVVVCVEVEIMLVLVLIVAGVLSKVSDIRVMLNGAVMAVLML